MALLLGALQDALLNPGDQAKAKAAAEEVAGYERDIGSLRSDLGLLKWMLGFVLTIAVATAGSQAALWFKMGEIGSQLTAIAAHIH